MKYALDPGVWRRSDVNQLLAFTVAHETQQAILINFSPQPNEPASARITNTVLTRLSWQLSLTPAQAAFQLVASVKERLSAILSGGDAPTRQRSNAEMTTWSAPPDE